MRAPAQQRRRSVPFGRILTATFGVAVLLLVLRGWSSQHPIPRSQCTARLEAAGLHYGGAAVSDPNSGLYRRKQAYDAVEKSARERGLDLSGPVVQGLSLADLFVTEGGKVQPVLHDLEVPVRAVVAPIRDKAVSAQLHDAVRKHFLPVVGPAHVWLQRPDVYHSTVWHFSHHQFVLEATEAQQQEELRALRAATAKVCALHFVLERVVLTSSGVVMAVWQVARGAGPEDLRAVIQAAVPKGPPSELQMVKNKAIWHTTLARLVDEPESAAGMLMPRHVVEARLQGAVHSMTAALCGTRVTYDRLLYVREHHILALGLAGHWTEDDMLLSTCARTQL